MLLLEGRNRPVTGLAFSPDATRLAVSGGVIEPVELWDVSARAIAWIAPSVYPTNPVDNVRFDPTGQRLWLAGAANGLFVVDTGRGTATHLKRFDFVSNIAIAPTEDCIVIYQETNQRLVAHELTAKGLGARRWSKSLFLSGLAFYSDGEQLATLEGRHTAHSGFETSLRVRSAADGRILDKTPCECESGWLAAVSPDGLWTAFHSNSYLMAYHAADAAKSVKLASPNRKHLTGIAFHPGGRYLAATSNDATVRFHDIDSGWEITRTFDWNIGKLKSIAFSHDGSLAAAGGEKGKVVVWDVDV